MFALCLPNLSCNSCSITIWLFEPVRATFFEPLLDRFLELLLATPVVVAAGGTKIEIGAGAGAGARTDAAAFLGALDAFFCFFVSFFLGFETALVAKVVGMTFLAFNLILLSALFT